ncbi:GcrA family cell cycle regulator [Bradyrhizobium sp. USDA 10063]
MSVPHPGSIRPNNSTKTAPWYTVKGLTGRLVMLHRDGVEFSAIARILTEEFGVPITKNQALGKARRMSLPRRRLDLAPSATPKPAKSAEPETPETPEPTELEPLPTTTLPRKALRCEHLPILALNPGECRFPSGEYPYVFCRQPQVAGSAYCARHFARAFCPRREL